jgi:hypothetical protein
LSKPGRGRDDDVARNADLRAQALEVIDISRRRVNRVGE